MRFSRRRSRTSRLRETWDRATGQRRGISGQIDALRDRLPRRYRSESQLRRSLRRIRQTTVRVATPRLARSRVAGTQVQRRRFPTLRLRVRREDRTPPPERIDAADVE